MEIFRAILHTKGKTKQDIEADGNKYSEEEIKIITEYMDAWDGVEVYVGIDFSGEGYLLAGWPEESDCRVKEAIYLMEQDTVFGSYRGDREGFDKVWELGEYEPDGMMCFDKGDVEILEKLN